MGTNAMNISGQSEKGGAAAIDNTPDSSASRMPAAHLPVFIGASRIAVLSELVFARNRQRTHLHLRVVISSSASDRAVTP